MSVKAKPRRLGSHVTVFVSENNPLRLVSCSSNGKHWFHIEGHPLELTIFPNQEHPKAHRLPAAVAAFNAVMDAKEDAYEQ